MVQMQKTTRLFRGETLRARAMRGSALTLMSFGGSNLLRLGGNLMLTRILFPEAFGLMALVQVFIFGLQMFSDLGIHTSVIRSPRGTDPVFLDSAWTVQVIRGGLLWLGCLGLAMPAATFYEQPQLLQLLPVAGLTILILGFLSINMATVNRNIMLGRLTFLELGSQGVGLAVMIVAALVFQSVWALVLGSLVDSIFRVVLSYLILPGRRAQFGLERSALLELFHFGKWIFIATIAGFLIQHGDRAILGRYITLTDLALYNIGFFLGAVPEMLNSALNGRILFPLYCNKPPSESIENRTKTLHARTLLTGSSFAISIPLIFLGDELVTLLYDPRYHGAGPILVAICTARLFTITTYAYGSVLLAAGASQAFAGLMIIGALVRSSMMVIGAMHFGIPGVVVGALLGEIIIYPFITWLIRPYGAWEWRHDIGFVVLMIVIGALAAWQDPTVWSAFFQN
jgi:O-antigen/teichoic acid export membrane protein